MGKIDLERIRLESFEKVTENFSDDVYGELLKTILDASSKVNREMISAVLESLEESEE